MKLSALAIVSLLAFGCDKNASVGDDKQLQALAERVTKLEKEAEKFAEVAAFVEPVMAQQKAQQEQQAKNEPDPDTRFAIAIDGDASDGPANAAVTIVEAFDFA